MLVANVASVLLLIRYKDGDANVRSVWLCSRNDAIGNVAVMLAAVAVWASATRMAGPDRRRRDGWAVPHFVGLEVLRQSWRELRTGAVAAAHGHAH